MPQISLCQYLENQNYDSLLLWNKAVARNHFYKTHKLTNKFSRLMAQLNWSLPNGVTNTIMYGALLGFVFKLFYWKFFGKLPYSRTFWNILSIAEISLLVEKFPWNQLILYKRFFHKNFVKATLSLLSLNLICFTEYFQVTLDFWFFYTVSCTVWKLLIFTLTSLWDNYHESIIKKIATVDFTKYFILVWVNFMFFHAVSW